MVPLFGDKCGEIVVAGPDLIGVPERATLVAAVAAAVSLNL